MPRSTLFFAGLAVTLAASIGYVGWRLTQYPGIPSGLLAGGSSFQLGIPGVQSDSDGIFTAVSALLWDTSTQKILFEQNGFERVPIASITKLMTAMVALDHGINWDQEVTIEPEEYVQGGQLLLQPGEAITMKDALHASLLSSANNATLAYVRTLGFDKREFVRAMNRKAIELGLEQTEFADVTGLDPRNISTAYEVARLAEVAFTKYPIIAEITAQKEYSFTVRGSDRQHTIRNANKLVTEWGMTLSASKTGYLYEAKYCLVAQGSGKDARKIAVVLGSPSEIEHLADMKKLLNWPVP